jgi:uncharacterized protein
VNPAHAVAALDWGGIARELDAEGFAVTAPLLSEEACVAIRGLYEDEATRYRSTIDLQRYNFGRGQYRYFAYPLPEPVQALRSAFYPGLAGVANAWAERLGQPTDWPASLDALTARCHAAGQRRPTPLLLRYGEGDYNCLHQDLYGAIHFPLQVIVLLSAPATEFEGGELVLVEQRPRMQSRAMVVPLRQGAAAIVPVRDRPRAGSRGVHRVQVRHGVAKLRRGRRTTLGLIFHDAA